jgi:hypothetical protein
VAGLDPALPREQQPADSHHKPTLRLLIGPAIKSRS